MIIVVMKQCVVSQHNVALVPDRSVACVSSIKETQRQFWKNISRRELRLRLVALDDATVNIVYCACE